MLDSLVRQWVQLARLLCHGVALSVVVGVSRAAMVFGPAIAVAEFVAFHGIVGIAHGRDFFTRQRKDDASSLFVFPGARGEWFMLLAAHSH
jgi:hypothetical protein